MSKQNHYNTNEIIERTKGSPSKNPPITRIISNEGSPSTSPPIHDQPTSEKIKEKKPLN